ncbi:MAG TPA: protein associating with small stress protein PASs1 [Epsilonproteobacteria bacterium]|nr:protein associating with small stress protein PASs1 [Campylobacterota bacterium]
MKCTIDKIPLSEMSYDTFVTLYLLPEKPLIITGVDSAHANGITSEHVKNLFQDESKKSIGWYDAPLNPSDKAIPSFLHDVLAREDMSVRPLPMRLFMQPNGHKTLYHYDGNSLHGFNLQMKGKKRWCLISPHTPLTSAPLMFVSLVGKNFVPDAEYYDYYEFETVAGEMLFLPRYWIHSVSTQAEENINYNWVVTPTFPHKTSPLGRRESELLFLRKKIPFLNRFLVDSYGEYGGAGESIVEEYIKDVGYIRMCTRICKEISTLPKTLFLMKEIKSMASEFEENNFKV